MAKTNRPRRSMDRYFKNLQRNTYLLSYNKKGSSFIKIRKWDVIRRLNKKLVTEDEQTGKVHKEPRYLDHGVPLLPRRDVMLYGTIPAMEQRVYSKCKNCSRVFNPHDILSHRTCSKSHTPHSSLLKKKVKSKSGTSKKTSSNGNSSSNSTNSNSSVVTTSSGSPVKDPLKDFEFKRPYTPPPIKAASAAVAPLMPELKVSVTKIGISKVAKSTPITMSTNTTTSTTSSDKSDSKVSASKATSSVHSPKSPSSGYHSSRSSSGHSLRSPSSSSSTSSSLSGHHDSKNVSLIHHTPKSPSSSGHHRSKSPSSHYSPRAPSKSSSSSSHYSSKSSSSKSTPMDTLPPSSSSSHHHHSSSSSSHSSSRHKKSSSSSSKRSNSSGSGSSSKTLPKNYDPDIHCGVTEGNRGPCMRSITCSNHRLHLRKQVSGRSKDIHQLIVERKAAKENDLKHTNPSCSYTSPNGEAKDMLSPNTSCVPAVGQAVSTSIDSSVTNSFVPIMPKASGHTPKLSTTSVFLKKLNSSVSESESAKTVTNLYTSLANNIIRNIENTQDNVVGTVPVVIMPMSPVSVGSSVQLLKIGNNIISLEPPQSATNPPVKKQMMLPIPSNHTNGIRMYKSHPKPVILPNFGARILGGAILLENQKNDVMTDVSGTADAPQYSEENNPSQHELIIRLIDKYGF